MDQASRKRDEWIVRLGILGLAIFFGGSFIFGLLRANWTHYWLTQDPVQATALITGERSHGVVDYEYNAGPMKFTGRSQRNQDQEKYRTARIGQESIVYYSRSHPSYSSLETPIFPVPGSIILLVAIPIELMFLITAANPRSKWALNILPKPGSP